MLVCFLSIFVAFVAFEILSEWMIKWLRSDFQWLITKDSDLFACPNKESAKRFFESSFDKELGWDRKPNTQKKEIVKTIGEYRPNAIETSYSINSQGARNNKGHEALPVLVSSYGDSFAFSRHVNDDETWQWFLSEKTRTNVLNFGVGNYGADQALLRFKRHHEESPAAITLFMVVPETISRVLNIWKHYSEYGNLLGFKGRYKLESSGTLDWINNPIHSIDDYDNIQSIASGIQKEDDCYKLRFKKDLLKRPYLLNILKRPNRHLRLLYLLFKRKRELKRANAKESVINAPWAFILQQNREFIKTLYASSRHRSLLKKILIAFKHAAIERGTKPVFIMAPYLHDLYDANDGRCAYQSFIEELSLELPVLDLTTHMVQLDNFEELYVSDFFGAHFSPKGNKIAAEKIYEFLTSSKYLDKLKVSA